MSEMKIFSVEPTIEYQETTIVDGKPTKIAAERENRDSGKHFSVELLSAWDAEKWASEAVFAIAKTHGSMEALAGFGIAALMQLPFDKYESLMGRLMARVKFVKDPMKPHDGIAILPAHFQEVSTLFKLKKFILEAHINFYTSGNP